MEETISRFFLIILLFLTIFSSALAQEGINKPICQTKECLFAAQNLKESMDINVHPCDNFYLYACGNWPKVHINRNNRPQSTLGLRSEENDQEILDFLQRDSNRSAPASFLKARKLFSLCLNESAYTGGIEKIKLILQKIGLRIMPFAEDTNENFDYEKVLARANKQAGIKMYFDLLVSPNPYNQTANMIGLRTPEMLELDDTSLPFKKRFRSRISKRTNGNNEQMHLRLFINEILKIMCTNGASKACTSNNPYASTPRDWIIDQLEKQINDLSEISNNFQKNTIPEIYNLNQLQDFSDVIANEVHATIPKFNWTRYIEEMFIGLDNVKLDLSNTSNVPIIVENLDFIKNALKFMYSKRKELMYIEWDIWWKTVSTLLPYINSNIFDAKNTLNDFDGSHPTRKHRCAAITITSFGAAMNYGYSTKEKYVNAKIRITRMLEHMRGSFGEIIHQASWMDEKTRQKALIKLKSMKSNIVYPGTTDKTSSVDDFYRDVQITDNFFDTIVAKIQKQINKTLNRLNQLNDLAEEYWTPPNIVNGFFNQYKNTIIIPGGLVGGSIYSDSLRALDYGAIGSILGHELTHAFDNLGRQFNEIGNIENWWQNETLNSYRDKAKCFIKAYANYSMTFNGYILNVTNSTANQDEDISDNSAFKESLLAYRRSVSELGEEPLLPQFHNFTHEQLLTLAYANIFCENPTYESVADYQYNNYSPDGVRVNVVIKNSKEFSKIWNCPKGSNMNPSDKCSVW